MNQITHSIPSVTITHNDVDFRQEIDCSPPKEMQFQAEEQEIEGLRSELERLTRRNDELKQAIDYVYSSPTEKRQLLAQLEKKYGISRRRACRLLSFARSTCWYRSAAGQGIADKDTNAVATLSNSALIQRLKKLARQTENGFIPLNESVQSQFEYGLNRLGLTGASHLSRTNLKLAIEIFSVWCRQGKS